MNAAQQYANMICEKYGVEPKTLPPGSEDWTIGKVAANVLPDSQLQRWLYDEKNEYYKLRYQFKIAPVGKFDSLTLEDLQELRL